MDYSFSESFVIAIPLDVLLDPSVYITICDGIKILIKECKIADPTIVLFFESTRGIGSTSSGKIGAKDRPLDNWKLSMQVA